MENLARHMAQVLRLKPEEITDGLTMADVDTWDSLSHMELVVCLEQAYGVNFSGDDIVEMTTVAAIREALARCRKAAA